MAVTTHHQGFPDDAGSEEPACQCKKRTLIRISTDFSGETLRGRRKWNNIVKVLKDKIKKKSVKNTLPNKLLLFKYEGKIKGFPEKEKLRKFINTKSSLQ